MLGSFRFTLALAVMISHYPFNGLAVNIGVMSVIGFYVISGYLMQKSYTRFQNHSATPVRHFYRDRLLKLMPLYWIVLIISYAAISLLGNANTFSIMNQPLTPEAIALNALLIPVNYVFDPLIIENILPHPAIPPAWSLASEFHFYLLLPLLFILPVKALTWVALGSLFIQMAAIFNLTPWLTADGFGYRFITGVLVFFVMGMLLAKSQQLQNTKLPLYGLYGLFAVAMCIIMLQPELKNAWALEEWLGILIALPLISVLLSIKPKNQRWQILDKKIGQLAYPLFIVHFLIFYLYEQIGLNPQGSMFLAVCGISSILVAALLAQIQARLEKSRLQLRGFDSMQNKNH